MMEDAISLRCASGKLFPFYYELEVFSEEV